MILDVFVPKRSINIRGNWITTDEVMIGLVVVTDSAKAPETLEGKPLETLLGKADGAIEVAVLTLSRSNEKSGKHYHNYAPPRPTLDMELEGF